MSKFNFFRWFKLKSNLNFLFNIEFKKVNIIFIWGFVDFVYNKLSWKVYFFLNIKGLVVELVK